MRTIITLRPTKDGKTTVTRKQLFDRFVQRGGKRARDTSTYEEALAEFRSVSAKFREAQRAYRAKEIGDQEFLEAKRKFDEAGSKVDKAEQQSGSDAKDLFIGNRGLNWEREDRFTDKAYTGDRRRIIVHNHLPVRKANDAVVPVVRGEDQPISLSELRGMGRARVNSVTSSAVLREWCRTHGINRAQEAFVVEGWKQARMEAGLSENT